MTLVILICPILDHSIDVIFMWLKNHVFSIHNDLQRISKCFSIYFKVYSVSLEESFFVQLHISEGKFSAKVWYLYQLFMCREKTLQTKFYQTTLTSICASPVKKHVIYSNLLSLHHFLFYFVNFYFDTFYIIHKIYLYCIEKMRVINFGWKNSGL